MRGLSAAAHLLQVMQRGTVLRRCSPSTCGAPCKAMPIRSASPHQAARCPAVVGTQLAKRDIRKAQKALGHKRIDTTAQHYVLDELEEGLTDDLY